MHQKNTTSQIDNLLLDWSGTISDDLNRVYEVNMRVFEYLGHDRISFEKFRRDFNIPVLKLYRQNKIDADWELISQKYAELWSKIDWDIPKLHPSSRETISKLAERYWLGVLSSHPHQALVQEISHHGLTQYFQHIEGDCVSKAERIDAIAKKHKLIKARTLYVGDTISDIRSGKQAGVLTASVANGYQSESQLLSQDPTFHLPDFSKIIALLA